uniref:T-cell receptor alpha/delta variable 14.0 n=1 Tax=Paramormyrops kingsleyae TaxID=1676925 RepID=A0A3B3Q4Z8_9TELE
TSILLWGSVQLSWLSLRLVIRRSPVQTHPWQNSHVCGPLSEGKSETLDCTYASVTYSLQWYRQYPRSAPKFLMLITESSEPKQNTELRMSIKVDKNNKLLHLELYSTEVTDSAVYYCALSPTVTGNSLTLYKNLTASQQLMRFFLNYQTVFQ